MLPFRQACFRSAIESILKRECPQKARPAKETEAYVQGANFTAESSKSRRRGTPNADALGGDGVCTLVRSCPDRYRNVGVDVAPDIGVKVHASNLKGTA
jgi:hypothetical protein